MDQILLTDNEKTFNALFLKAHKPSVNVLFAVGSGGNPERHLPLLVSLKDQGCNIIAPYFEKLASPIPTADEIHIRLRRFNKAIDFISSQELPLVGIGHSIGATVLLTLAGAQMWMKTGECLSIKQDHRIKKLVLMTPPTGFFRAPNSLAKLQISIQGWAGTLDSITPPEQLEFLKQSLKDQVSFDIHTIDGAGHFSFMNILPPLVVDTLPNRESFHLELTHRISKFIFD